MHIRKTWLWLFFLLSVNAKGRETIDDPAMVARRFLTSNNIAEKTSLAFLLGCHHWTARKLPEAKKWFKTCLQITPVATDSNDVIDAQNFLANVYLNEAAYDSALFFCNASFMSIRKIKNQKLLPNLYQTKGRIFLPLGDQESAVQFFIKADSLYEISPFEEMKAQSPYIKIALGQIFQRQNQMSRAKEYYEMALQLSHTQKSLNTIASSMQTLAQWYCAMKQYKKAGDIFYELLRPPLLNSISYRMVYIYTGLGDVYMGLKKPDSSLYFYKLGLIESKEKGEVYQADLFYCKMGDANFKMHNIPLAKLYYDSSLEASKKNNNRTSSISACQSLAEIAVTETDYKKAFEYLSLKEQLKDSAINLKSVEMSNNLYILNNIKQKDVAINTLTALDIDNKKIISQGKTITSLLFGFTGLLVLSFFIFTKRLKLKRRLEKQLIITEERERIIADLHDDAGSTLSSIHIYSELAANMLEAKPGESKVLMGKISQQGKDLLNRMSDIIWSLKPGGEQKFSITARLTNYSQELLASKNIKTEFNIDEILDTNLLNPQVRKNMLLIVKEAMHNVAKYSGAANAVITLQQVNERIILSIEDDGNGFELQTATAGNGLNNMRQRSLHIGGRFLVTSAPGNGTTVSVSFPIAIISHTI
ncbi:hypothetical protein BH10BAC3_BH10BAC3_16400 [soil metagenome]